MNIQLPEKAKILFQPKRYKILYGGRGSAKSTSCAVAMLAKGVERPLRCLCARQLQTSIAESVHKLLQDCINDMGLSHFYEVQRDKIIGLNGTSIVFEGIHRNVSKIKSMQGIDICWVEEAEKVTEESWSVLTPTIRKDGSEIWITFNPELEEDPTYVRFIKNPPKESLAVFMNWSDNPWFPESLSREMEELRERNYEDYLHVYGGQCIKNVSGAVYGGELIDAKNEGRIREVRYDQSLPVDAFFDLGWADSTTIWLAQKVDMEYRILEYIEDSQKPIGFYLKVLENKRYRYGTFWLPHDAKAHEKGSGLSVEEIVRNAGKHVRIVPKLSIDDGINAARTIFPNCFFDENKCVDGLNALRHYRYEIGKKDGSPSRQPVHDWASHGSDAFRYLAIALKAPKKEKSKVAELAEKIQKRFQGAPNRQPAAWMGN
jgi:phage terminase large subunit